MNAVAEFSIRDPGLFRQQLCCWASGFEHACYLDGNGYPVSWTGFDCMAGAGAAEVLQPSGESLPALRQLMDQEPSWLLGYFGYDLKNEIEKLYSANPDPLDFPALCFFRPRTLVWVRGERVRIQSESSPEAVFREICQLSIPADCSPGNDQARVLQNMSFDSYRQAVEAIRGHILEGDIYEMNFCMEFYAEDVECDPFRLFTKLNQVAPAPFAAFLRCGEHFVLSASPERFLRKSGSRLLSQPIKGTAPRGSSPEEDEAFRLALLDSEKERAENVMIVDIVRNDLARSAVPGSVKVPELFGIYRFPHWHQMISSVEAEARPGAGALDIIRNAFPMASMTGAPKIRAMELIEKYERSKRGVFSGAIGYFSPDGDFDMNVVIRSFLYNRARKRLAFPVGSAITYDSCPEREYEECLLKARALHRLLQNALS